MGKVYAPPKSIGSPPPIDFEAPKEEWFKGEKIWMENLKAWVKDNSKDPNAGELIRFPVADGHAVYMVLSLKPTVKLIHIPLGDAWTFQYVHRLTAADIKELIAQTKAMAKLFGTRIK